MGDGKEDKWHREALAWQKSWHGIDLYDGTYELIGPKVNGNKEQEEKHWLVFHGADTLEYSPRTFDSLKALFEQVEMEGIVWHHPDGRMVKIKKKDFGYKW